MLVHAGSFFTYDNAKKYVRNILLTSMLMAYDHYMNDKTISLALDIIDQLERVTAILTVASEMEGLDKAMAKTLGHCAIDLLPAIEATAFKLIEDPKASMIEKSETTLTA